jgi:DNA-binding IclR family transcriptional regulator
MKQKNSQNSKYKVQALERALDILDCFSFQNRELSLSEVVKITGLNKTTVKRLISNLESRGYLQHDPQTRTYQLGMRLFELGGIVFSSFSLRRAAALPMSNLQSQTGATVLLGAQIDDQLVYIDKREGNGMLRISSDVGWRRPLHYGMLGMVLMSSLDAKTVREILAQYPLQPHTPFSITDQDAFSLRLEQIRDQGYVLEREEAVEGVMGIAAPIRDYTRQVTAALGIAAPLGQRNLNKNADRLVSLVQKACGKISSDLGYLKI